ncbi:MAG: LptF/LptG family permease [Planctomycetota bacterium]
MWRLHRYYLKELAINFAITFVVLFAIVLLSLITKGINMTEGGPLWAAFVTIVLLAIDTFSHLVTIAFLVGTVLTYARAGQDRELVALRAAGLSPRVAMAPAVLVGIALTVLASFANHYVIPDVHYSKYRILPAIASRIYHDMRLGSDRIPLPGQDMVATYRGTDGEWWTDCTIYAPASDRRLKGMSPIVRAARIRKPVLSETDASLTIEIEGIEDPIQAGAFSNLKFVIGGSALDKNRRPDKDDDMRSDQLLSEVQRGVHFRPNEAAYTLFRRCCFSLMPALLAPIGFCLAEMMRNRGRVLALVIALLPLVLFYLGDFAGARVIRSSGNPWGAWIPVLMLVLFGMPVCWRQLRR